MCLQDGHASKVALNSYVLDQMGYDCVLGGTIETPLSYVYSNTMHVHQTFGFLVVAPQPQVQPVPLVNSLFMWLRPFSGGVWGITVLTFFMSAALMAWFEQGAARTRARLRACAALTPIAADAFEEELGTLEHADRSVRLRALLVHGLYISFSTFTTQNAEGFKAQTLPGRIYRTVYAFATLLTISCYVANLAAVLVTPATPSALINTVGDFAANNLAACVLNNSDHIQFMQAQYPETKQLIINSMYTSDLLRCVPRAPRRVPAPPALL